MVPVKHLFLKPTKKFIDLPVVKRPNPPSRRPITMTWTRVKTHVVKNPPQFQFGRTREVIQSPMARHVSGTLRATTSMLAVDWK